VSSRAERKAAARAAREQAERAEQATAARRRRITQLLGVLVAAAVVVGILIAVSSGGGNKSKSPNVTAGQPAPGGAEATRLLGGIPERGLTLGGARAPVTMVEYADMQCPICRAYTSDVFPTLVRNYVRAGKVRMELRLQAFIGPESTPAALAVIAAGLQNKAWLYADVFYANQGQENSGYVTDDFLRSVGLAVPGLDVNRMMRDRNSPQVKATLAASQAEFDRLGLTGTPSFRIGRTGGPLSVLNWQRLTPDEFTGPINSLLGR
jgi:multidrug efflux pump subunit AcrA (membrane-fusion protein)